MSAGRFPVFQHRGGTPPITIRKILNCLADLPWEGVPIGADRAPPWRQIAPTNQSLVSNPYGVPLLCRFTRHSARL
jgi:hypothetical protein